MNEWNKVYLNICIFDQFIFIGAESFWDRKSTAPAYCGHLSIADTFPRTTGVRNRQVLLYFAHIKDICELY